MYATQYRESYPYCQHEKIGYNYRMSNICAGIGRGQMTILNDHLAHHKHVQRMYEELLVCRSTLSLLPSAATKRTIGAQEPVAFPGRRGVLSTTRIIGSARSRLILRFA